jgi:hypothetical protein
MRQIIWLILILILGAGVAGAAARAASAVSLDQAMPTPTQGSEIAIDSPKAGQALQGSVAVMGSSAVEGFRMAEVSFGYASDQTHTWFLISQVYQPMSSGALVTWDTTTISDGDYNLKLAVILQDGSQKSVQVRGLRVRNYTPVETMTPAPPGATATLLPTVTAAARLSSEIAPAATLRLTPTPGVPVQISRSQVYLSLGEGALFVFGVFAALGVYQLLRSVFHRGAG